MGTLLPTLLLVRPQAQAAQQAQRLVLAGIDARPFCVQDTAPDHAALAQLPTLAAGADWLIFVSPSCVALAWPLLAGLPLAANLACVGRASGEQLAAASGQRVLYPATGNDSEALLALAPLQQLHAKHILIVRGDGGRAQLGETLARRGAQVRYAEVYRREARHADWALFDRLLAQSVPPALLVTSSDSAELLFAQAGSARQASLQRCRFLALHPRIAERLRTLGACHITIASDEQALLTALADG